MLYYEIWEIGRLWIRCELYVTIRYDKRYFRAPGS